MPKYAHAQLRWSEQAQLYVLFFGDQESHHTLTSEWLEQNPSFAFHSRSGIHFTARKQKVQRGTSYWYGYRRQQGRIVKRYLGKTADLTLARLEEIARLLESMSSSEDLSPQSPQETTFPQLSLHAFSPSSVTLPTPVATPPLLLSKLSPPRLHHFLLDRPRLFTLLDTGREGHLTLLSAPAGFGKTTLVSQWMAARRASPAFPSVAWVSLEVADNDPTRFWRYLLAACQNFQVDLAETHAALAAITPQPPFLPQALETVVATFLNALAQGATSGILVLEDYHAITSPEIHKTLSFFLEHLPANIHLILIARSDPPFPLARLRASHAVCEIRRADLSFSPEETAILLHHALPFPLERSLIQQLHTQLEGWGAGLHLMQLALQRATTQEERAQVLSRWLGNPPSYRAYFVSEVLEPQPEPVQQFLLQTSFLPRLTASLCDAVTRQHQSQEMLMLLERANVFLEPLDLTTLHQPQDSQQWFRYHALFAEAMRDEARHRFSAEYLQELSICASCWYEAHGLLSEAIEAALLAQDYPRAAVLIKRVLAEYSLPGEIQEPQTLQRWFEQFPPTLLEQNTVLAFGYATTQLFQSASWLPAASMLRLVEKLLQRAEHVWRAEKQLAKLGELFAFRALLALRQNERGTAILHAKQALDWLEPAQHIWRGLSLSIVADEWTERGDYQQARAALLEAHTLCEAVGNRYFKRVVLNKLAQVFFEQGEIQQALALYRRTLAQAREDGQPFPLCNALVGLATLLYEENELESADQHAQEAVTASQTHHLVYYEAQATIMRARVQQAQGHVVVAQQLLTDLLNTLPFSFPHLSQVIQAAQARVALAGGDHLIMQRWVNGRSPHPDFSQNIDEELLLSRWLRIQGDLEEASSQLERLLVTTQKVGNTRRILEIQVEMVLVAAAKKHKDEAQQVLRAVLVQALPEHFLRPFLDAGEQMAILLRSLIPQLHQQPLVASLRSLLSAFPAQQQDGTQAQSSLIDPLSPQEMRVLRLLAQHRSNADIANELVVSVNTVRSQVQSIYSKLGVHTRSAASDVAREFQLL